MDFSEKTYSEMSREYNRLNDEYSRLFDECAKKGIAFQDFMEKAHDIKERIYFLDKYMRLKQDPSIEMGKEWQGEKIPFDLFVKRVQNDYYTDEDGYGYYATEDAKSDIKIIPSDIKEKVYRNDFTFVIWINS